jgi:hypothetical protein
MVMAGARFRLRDRAITRVMGSHQVRARFRIGLGVGLRLILG